MTQTVLNWNTKKTESGFEFRVYSIGYDTRTETLKTGTAASRAVAKRLATRWMMYFKAEQKKGS